jgi:outer membrane lipoprotein-sorting protein
VIERWIDGVMDWWSRRNSIHPLLLLLIFHFTFIVSHLTSAVSLTRRNLTMIKIIQLILILLTTASFAQENLLEKIDGFRVPYKEFLVRTKITTYEKDELKEIAVFNAYMNGNDKSLVVAKEYKTKGMKLLYVDENLWIQLPTSRRPIRITPIQRLMGEASNGDVARVSLADDYAAEIIGSENINGVDCHKMLLLAKKKSATYHKIVLYSRKEDYRPMKAEYYVVSGKHIKTAFFIKFMPIAGKIILEQMTIYDELKKDNKTVFEYLKIEEKQIPVKYFNKNYLINVRDL